MFLVCFIMQLLSFFSITGSTPHHQSRLKSLPPNPRGPAVLQTTRTAPGRRNEQFDPPVRKVVTLRVQLRRGREVDRPVPWGILNTRVRQARFGVLRVFGSSSYTMVSYYICICYHSSFRWWYSLLVATLQ